MPMKLPLDAAVVKPEANCVPRRERTAGPQGSPALARRGRSIRRRSEERPALVRICPRKPVHNTVEKVTFLQHFGKNGSPLKACPEKQRSRNCANENTSARNSTVVWNSQLSQNPAFPAKSAAFHFDFMGISRRHGVAVPHRCRNKAHSLNELEAFLVRPAID
jgi:hypothetical protein